MPSAQAVYRPRDAEHTVLYGVVREHLDTFLRSAGAGEERRGLPPFIEREFPHLAAHYRKAYATSWHLSERYRASLGKFFDKLCRKYGVEGGMGRSDAEEEEEAERTELPAQLGLWE